MTADRNARRESLLQHALRRSWRSSLTVANVVLVALSLAACGAMAGTGSTSGGTQNIPTRVHQVLLPAPAITDAQLGALSCASSDFCVAVGIGQGGTFIERWDGQRWRVSTQTGSRELFGVACASSRFCLAVGRGASQTLVERWDGSGWREISSPNPSPGFSDTLTGVACASASSCWAVGGAAKGDGSRDHSITEHWNGSGLTPVRAPGQVLGTGSISCWASGGCLAGGSTIMVESRGHWSGFHLAGEPEVVTCGSTLSTCWLVTGADTLERVSGQATPAITEPHGIGGTLNAIACRGAGPCWVVGESTPLGGSLPSSTSLAEAWNGSRWLTLTVSGAGTALNNTKFTAASCAPDGYCLAVGGGRHGVDGDLASTAAILSPGA